MGSAQAGRRRTAITKQQLRINYFYNRFGEPTNCTFNTNYIDLSSGRAGSELASYVKKHLGEARLLIATATLPTQLLSPTKLSHSPPPGDAQTHARDLPRSPAHTHRYPQPPPPPSPGPPGPPRMAPKDPDALCDRFASEHSSSGYLNAQTCFAIPPDQNRVPEIWLQRVLTLTNGPATKSFVLATQLRNRSSNSWPGPLNRSNSPHNPNIVRLIPGPAPQTKHHSSNSWPGPQTIRTRHPAPKSLI